MQHSSARNRLKSARFAQTPAILAQDEVDDYFVDLTKLARVAEKDLLIFDKAEDADRLVVALHAYTLRADSLESVVRVIRKAPGFAKADIVRPDLPMGMFSAANMNALVKSVLRIIDEYYSKRRYKEIYFVGHSVGGLLARKVYITSLGETEEAPFETELAREPSRVWADKVKRIVLLAGMNRGWCISYHLSMRTAIAVNIGTVVGRLLELGTGKKLLIFQVHRGAPFLTQLRLQWLAMRKKQQAESKLMGATTVQLLGSIDDIVSPEDNIDLISGRDFIYLDVGFSGHQNVIEMDDPRHGQARSEQLVKALSSPISVLKSETVQVSDFRPRQIDSSVDDVIFVVHGIRDAGYWTQKIGRRVARVAGNKRKFAMVTSSYGYFPMAPFLLAAKRREKVEWFMDQYAEAKACYPNAQFSCIGHSNGTYLIAKALELYPACRFERLVFAGSVVQQGYQWRTLLQAQRGGRVHRVTNYVASRDWVVAWFPKLFQFIGLQDIGSAGHDGFDEEIEGTVEDRRFVRGGHAAALDERNWDAIAHFIVTGDVPNVPEELRATRRAFWVEVPGFCPLIVWIIIIVLLLLGARTIFVHVADPAARTLAIIAYLWAIWQVLTRV